MKYNIKNIELVLLKYRSKFSDEEWKEIERALTSKKDFSMTRIEVILLLRELLKILLGKEL